MRKWFRANVIKEIDPDQNGIDHRFGFSAFNQPLIKLGEVVMICQVNRGHWFLITLDGRRMAEITEERAKAHLRLIRPPERCDIQGEKAYFQWYADFGWQGKK